MDANREYNRSYTVSKRLLPRHHQIEDLALQGHTAVSIAAKLNIPSRQVYNIINSPTFQHTLSLRRARTEDTIDEDIIRSKDAVLEAIRAQTMKAIDKLTDLIDSPSDAVARQAANDILDRGGYPKTTKTENTNQSTIIMDAEQSALIQSTLKELEPSPPEDQPEQ
jgi:hypothetical protein